METSHDQEPPRLGDGDGDGDRDLDLLLDQLHRTRGFDFGGYKRTSLSRRVQHRMQLVGSSSYGEYAAHLERHPDEFAQLFNAVLVNVTQFFRDPGTWDALARRIPALVAARGDKPLRVWSVGCASGEEAYTLAMVLGETLGLESFGDRVKIYATDADEDALADARLATYAAKAVDGVPAPIRDKYFVRAGTGWAFHKDLRRAVIFGRHDLLQDAPISRVDILACRNTLMYFHAEAQARILKRLHFALTDTGVLVLGKAEMLLSHSELFSPLDLKQRIFTRAPRATRNRARLESPAASRAVPPTSEAHTQLLVAAIDACPVALVALDLEGRLSLANQQAQAMFTLSPSDLGKPFQDLELSYRPAELRSHLDDARLGLRLVHLREVERIGPTGERSYLDVTIGPVLGATSTLVGTFVAFVDVTRQQLLQSQLRRTNIELEAAHGELNSTSEELETTNEELQSTVEELETTNEELQSANQELLTLNDELLQRSNDLREASAFFGSILASLTGGVAVLDRELVVRAWNTTMEELMGVPASEAAGKHFLNLELGLPVDHLAAAMRACLSTGHESVHRFEAKGPLGKKMACRVVLTPLLGSAAAGVIVLVEEVS